MSEQTRIDFKPGDLIWLVLSDEWLDAIQSEARSGDESNMRLYVDCLDAKRAGEERLKGTVEYVNVPLDEKGYGHANVMVPALGCRTSSDAIGAEFSNLERRDA